jgi:hypothetical protein
LRCRHACDPRNNVFPSASKCRLGNRRRETKFELRARDANETPEPNSNSYSNSNPNAYSYIHSDSDADSDGHSHIYADRYSYDYIHSDSNPDSDGHSYRDIYSHANGYIHSDTNADCDLYSYANTNVDTDCNPNGGASGCLLYYGHREPTLERGLRQCRRGRDHYPTRLECSAAD